jgi:hypothetical protein
MATAIRELTEQTAELEATMRAPALESYASPAASVFVPPAYVPEAASPPTPPPAPVQQPEREQIGAVEDPPIPGWVKVGVLFAGWNTMLSTADMVTYWVDRLA